MRKCEQRHAAVVVRVGVGRPQRDAEKIVSQLPQRGLSENAKPGAKDRLIISKRAESDADTRIVIAPIGVPQALRQVILARRYHIGARERHVSGGQLAGIERDQKSVVVRLQQRAGGHGFVQENVGNHDIAVARVEVGDVALVFREFRKHFPSQPEVHGQTIVYLPLILGVNAPLSARLVGVGTACHNEIRVGRAQQEIAE